MRTSFVCMVTPTDFRIIGAYSTLNKYGQMSQQPGQSILNAAPARSKRTKKGFP